MVDLPTPEAPGEPVESVEEDPLLQGEPEAPDPGHVLRFIGSDWYIKGFGPAREGLPNVYELRCPSGLVRRGPFAMLLGLLETQMGGDLGEWTVQEPRPEPGGHLNMREQTVDAAALPGVQHGYAHRKRR